MCVCVVISLFNQDFISKNTEFQLGEISHDQFGVAKKTLNVEIIHFITTISYPQTFKNLPMVGVWVNQVGADNQVGLIAMLDFRIFTINLTHMSIECQYSLSYSVLETFRLQWVATSYAQIEFFAISQFDCPDLICEQIITFSKIQSIPPKIFYGMNCIVDSNPTIKVKRVEGNQLIYEHSGRVYGQKNNIILFTIPLQDPNLEMLVDFTSQEVNQNYKSIVFPSIVFPIYGIIGFIFDDQEYFEIQVDKDILNPYSIFNVLNFTFNKTKNSTVKNISISYGAIYDRSNPFDISCFQDNSFKDPNGTCRTQKELSSLRVGCSDNLILEGVNCVNISNQTNETPNQTDSTTSSPPLSLPIVSSITSFLDPSQQNTTNPKETLPLISQNPIDSINLSTSVSISPLISVNINPSNSTLIDLSVNIGNQNETDKNTTNDSTSNQIKDNMSSTSSTTSSEQIITSSKNKFNSSASNSYGDKPITTSIPSQSKNSMISHSNKVINICSINCLKCTKLICKKCADNYKLTDTYECEAQQVKQPSEKVKKITSNVKQFQQYLTSNRQSSYSITIIQTLGIVSLIISSPQVLIVELYIRQEHPELDYQVLRTFSLFLLPIRIPINQGQINQTRLNLKFTSDYGDMIFRNQTQNDWRLALGLSPKYQVIVLAPNNVIFLFFLFLAWLTSLRDHKILKKLHEFIRGSLVGIIGEHNMFILMMWLYTSRYFNYSEDTVYILSTLTANLYLATYIYFIVNLLSQTLLLSSSSCSDVNAFKERYRPFFERYESKRSSFIHGIFSHIRKFSIVLVVILIEEAEYIYMICISVQSIWLCTILILRPFASKSLNIKHIIIQSLFIAYMAQAFRDFLDDNVDGMEFVVIIIVTIVIDLIWTTVNFVNAQFFGNKVPRQNSVQPEPDDQQIIQIYQYAKYDIQYDIEGLKE